MRKWQNNIMRSFKSLKAHKANANNMFVQFIISHKQILQWQKVFIFTHICASVNTVLPP